MQPGTKDVPINERVQILEDDVPNLVEHEIVTLNI
jgi:hypothetical protein